MGNLPWIEPISPEILRGFPGHFPVAWRLYSLIRSADSDWCLICVAYRLAEATKDVARFANDIE